jgi:hypothetical protein
MKEDLLDIETRTFLADISFDGPVTPYPKALQNMTPADAIQLKELREKLWRIDPTEDHKDGGLITVGVLGEIDRLLKEIIARKALV